MRRPPMDVVIGRPVIERYRAGRLSQRQVSDDLGLNYSPVGTRARSRRFGGAATTSLRVSPRRNFTSSLGCQL